MDAENLIYFFILTVLIALAAAELGLSRSIARRFRLPFTRTYLLYIICTLVFGLFAYIGQNMVWRVIASLADDAAKFKRVALYFPFLSFPFLIVAGFLFVRLFAELVNRRLPPWFARIYFAVQVVGFVVFGAMLLRAERLDSGRLDEYARSAQLFFGSIQLVILVLAVAIALRGALQVKLEARRRSIRRFVGLYICLDVSRIVLSLFMEDRLIVAIPYVLLFFGGELLPLLYLRHMLLRYWQRQHDPSGDDEWQSQLVRFDITPRQAEIIARICQGKSNHEIADELCISLQTVKTHVHNIFAKTSVSNRVQLTNLFRPS